MNCPGSVRMTRDLPNIETAYAKEGTAAHALAQVWLTHQSVDGITEIEGVPVTDEMREHVRTYVDVVRETHSRLGGQLLVEHKISLAEINPPVDMFGTADTILVADRALEVFDLKYGQGVPVEVVGNPQLLYYVLGAMFALAPEQRKKLDRVAITVVQPRAPHPDGPVRRWEITPEEMVRFAVQVREAAVATQRPGAPLVPGSQCRFCNAQGHCPALQQKAQALAQVEFAAMPLDRPPEPEHLPMTTVIDILSKASIIEDFFKALRVRVIRELEAGNEVPGWKLVAKRPARQWKSEDGVVEWAVAQGLAPTVIYDQVLRSPAQLEKQLGKKNVPDDLYVSVSSGHTLAPASDRRPAVKGGAAADFANVPETVSSE